MENTLRDLMLNGFLIYPKENKFILKKEIVPGNLKEFPESEYETYELALESAKFLMSQKQYEWTPIVRYNKGLGIEYKNLSNVFAENKEKALMLAGELAKKTLNKSEIHIEEIKVMLKN